MISVDRFAVTAPQVLTDANSSGIKERDEAIKFYGVATNKNLPYSYSAYKHESIQEKLQELFKGKCAYCEGKYVRLHPVDIEHFRPKGQIIINGQESKPGYYWLASTWENLLPSCIDCNRERYQKQFDGTKIKTGKKDKFPISDEIKRAKNPGDEINEDPLILNPCSTDKPEEHLEFTEDGFVRPKKNGKAAAKAIESINVYGLQRRALIEARKEKAILIRAQIERVQELKGDLDANINRPVTLQRLEREMRVLKSYMNPEQEYAGMARQLIENFLNSL